MTTERERRTIAERAHIERIHKGALDLLQLHYPLLIPKEPTAITLAHLGKKGGGAFYGGKLGDAHYVFLQRKDGELTVDGETANMIHELVHQRHAEVVGGEVFSHFSIEREAKKRKYRNLFPADVILKISREVNGVGVSLSETLSEGFAIFVEMDILGRELEIARILGREIRARSLKKELEASKKQLREYARENTWDAIYIRDGVNMVKQLFEFFGGDEETLTQFVLSVDFSQANEIEYGDPEYEMMVDNPLLLPRAV
ncbi:hypothetical protein A3G67_01345 [Candidatus Roizmanbacteria bacterium RIFCSPLOWO2_12_FULL_40_12]|uniref:Uncharacterized protein n=1 Tax=Candidatus Roizmanbacteria bacterium RIFCSPLOWO2_01_FULL_40_42 TaxID=1802066 RepID=A0A1F7J544_9BACT|nr:MAG: hypothetical protein A2779_01820 [Candidatus Roizmanbacteria bacterium RIFCSPHIGHO2_01_FULL_40_98]OGK28547.1 MAG: hypothetical protein A3C31_01140 [Candidatus Roizmanbacteria bacterium RIFCSPHIGHO2_02_FULL_40_53]OGK30417.1 MAG: hypothetical protein A2W49_00875 [Candidatus Roizmanbacteria bacterium RIFCSPHIGHO2_12_41_18]OGK36552.1 MAG: hypothetical protein A3E69_03420 [Candidatus Roizmanbacteria bacterium RIFCSPHIGHO2_12_FULL_40_130]OGK50735.1 MAG: hypothetical protein A3B50_04530 [Candi